MDLMAAANDTQITLSLFLTGLKEPGDVKDARFPIRTFARRLSEDDILPALDGYPQQSTKDTSQRKGTVCYVCGPPDMTDSIVSLLSQQDGMSEERVLCEKWW